MTEETLCAWALRFVDWPTTALALVVIWLNGAVFGWWWTRKRHGAV